jgi:hypothetical protein
MSYVKKTEGICWSLVIVSQSQFCDKATLVWAFIVRVTFSEEVKNVQPGHNGPRESQKIQWKRKSCYLEQKTLGPQGISSIAICRAFILISTLDSAMTHLVSHRLLPAEKLV